MKTFSIFTCAALLSGCGVSIRSQSKPAFDNLSGNYRHVGLGSSTPEEFPNPLIEFEDVAVPCDIEVSHEGHTIKAHYRSGTGSPVIAIVDLDKTSHDTCWKNGELVTTKRVPVEGPVILPLPARHYRGTRLFRDKDGNLVVVGFFEEKGLFWTDYSEQEIILERKSD